MPSNFTENYQLNQWEADDQVVRADFNADNAKIDAAIKAVETKTDTKADISALTALAQVVAGKGNCQVVCGQYTGSGLDVSKNPVTLTFDKKPVLVLVADSLTTLVAARGARAGVGINKGTSSSNRLTWTDNSVSWTISDEYGVSMNTKGTVYHYVAFLEA